MPGRDKRSKCWARLMKKLNDNAVPWSGAGRDNLHSLPNNTLIFNLRCSACSFTSIHAMCFCGSEGASPCHTFQIEYLRKVLRTQEELFYSHVFVVADRPLLSPTFYVLLITPGKNVNHIYCCSSRWWCQVHRKTQDHERENIACQ